MHYTQINRVYKANRTTSAFLNDNTSVVKMLYGCVGSGKSSACCVHIYQTAMQMPKGYDGVRRCKWAVIRKTYSQLKTTTIRTWCEWFPPAIFGEPKGDSPMTHTIKTPEFELEVIFLAIENLSDIDRLKSLEVTGIYVNEAQFFGSDELLALFRERTDRYPGSLVGGKLGRKLVIMDCNPPSIRHWIYRIFEKEKPEGFTIYKMPPAIVKGENGKWKNNPEADFIEQMVDKETGKGRNYWLDLATGASDEYISVNLCGNYGVLEDGLAVHPEYNDKFHYSPQKINANPIIEIGLGWDFGLTPACSVGQLDVNGQFRILHEFWTEHMSFRAFVENIVIPELDRLFPFWRNNYFSVHDPADSTGNEGNTNQQIMRELGINSYPAESNALAFRRDALKYFLSRLTDGKPGFLINESCMMIREGLMGKFKYPLITSTSLSEEKRYQEKPIKNIYSHICEATEYLATKYARVSKSQTTDKTEEFRIYNGSFMGS